MSILAVDDNHQNLQVLEAMLTGHGYDVTRKELASEILATRPSMPIVLCTGHNHQIAEEAAESTGIREFPMNPLSLDTLAQAIRGALARIGLPGRGDPSKREGYAHGR